MPAKSTSATTSSTFEEKDDLLPRIANDLAGMASAIRSACSQCNAFGLKLSFAELTDVACAELEARNQGTHPGVPARTLVVSCLTKFVSDKLSATRTVVGAPRQALTAKLRNGSFAKALNRVWVNASAQPTVVLQVDALVKKGFDAERMSWALAGYEAQKHIRLVWHQAHKLSRHFPDHRPADLVGWGWIGLRIALRSFEPERGFKFSTYACQRISGCIRDGVRQENPVPKRLTTFMRKVSKAEEDLFYELGRPPEVAEVALRLGETVESLAIMPRLQQTASIDEMASASQEKGGTLAQLVDEGDPADLAISSMRRQAIDDALSFLPPEEATAARLLLYEGVSVAEARNLTGATARQLRLRCQKAREKLKDELSEWA